MCLFWLYLFVCLVDCMYYFGWVVHVFVWLDSNVFVYLAGCVCLFGCTRACLSSVFLFGWLGIHVFVWLCGLLDVLCLFSFLFGWLCVCYACWFYLFVCLVDCVGCKDCMILRHCKILVYF